MPRNAAGVYSLPDPPRVPNTVIDSPDENTTRNDIGAELTNSLDRNGRGGMLAPFRIADGTLAAPGLAFLNEPGTGLWRFGAGDMRVSVQGTEVMRFTSGVVSVIAANFSVAGNQSVNGTFTVTGNATVTANLSVSGAIVLFPAQPLYFDGGIDTFMRELTPNLIDFVTGGFERLTVSGSSIHAVGVPVVIDAAQPLYMDGGNDTYITESSANVLTVVAGGLAQCDFQVGGVKSRGYVIIPAAQALYLDGGSDTLILENSPNVMHFICGGAVKLSLGGVLANFGSGVSIPAGQALYVDGGSDTYIVESSPNVLTMVAGGLPQCDFVVGGVKSRGYIIVPSGQAVYLDGGSDTFIVEGAANRIQLFAGGTVVAAFGNGVTQFVNFGIAVGAGLSLFLDGGGDTYMSEVIADTPHMVAGGIERWRTNAGGFTKFSNTGGYRNNVGLYHEAYSDNADNVFFVTNASATSPFGIAIFFTGANPNNSTNYFLDIQSAGGGLFARVRSNGGFVNFQANDLNLSDMTVKDYWEPYSTAQLEALSAAVDALDFGRYKYTAQTHDDWNHGYVAQGVREAFAAAAPELVDYWQDEKKDLLAVYSTDFININLAVAKHEIRKLKAEVADLKARLQ